MGSRKIKPNVNFPIYQEVDIWLECKRLKFRNYINMIVLKHILRESKDDFCSLSDKSLKYLPNGILGDLPIRLALEEELFDLQSIQLGHIGFVR